MGIYWTVMESITELTGLSPTAFFTIAVLMVMAYNTVCSMFVHPDSDKQKEKDPSHNNNNPPSPSPPQAQAPSPPVQLGDVTEQDLRAYDGSDPSKPLLMAINAQIYDVSASRMFYGPGGPYAMFAGRDASRALALMSFEPRDLTGNTEGLGESELEVLRDWELKFMEKYTKVGQIVS